MSEIDKAHSALIESSRAAIVAGDGDALLSALLTACMSDDPMPRWLQVQVAAAIRRYTHHKSRTLDEAFKVMREKNYHRDAAEAQRSVGMLVFFDIRDLRSSGFVLDDEMYEAVGSLHGVGKAGPKKWYAYWQRKLSDLPEAIATPRDKLRPALRELAPLLSMRRTTAKKKKSQLRKGSRPR